MRKKTKQTNKDFHSTNSELTMRRLIKRNTMKQQQRAKEIVLL